MMTKSPLSNSKCSLSETHERIEVKPAQKIRYKLSPYGQLKGSLSVLSAVGDNFLSCKDFVITVYLSSSKGGKESFGIEEKAFNPYCPKFDDTIFNSNRTTVPAHHSQCDYLGRNSRRNKQKYSFRLSLKVPWGLRGNKNEELEGRKEMAAES